MIKWNIFRTGFMTTFLTVWTLVTSVFASTIRLVLEVYTIAHNVWFLKMYSYLKGIFLIQLFSYF